MYDKIYVHLKYSEAILNETNIKQDIFVYLSESSHDSARQSWD